MIRTQRYARSVLTLAALFSTLVGADGSVAAASHETLLDSADGKNWAAYGRTYGEQHFSPLAQITTANVQRLGLVWAAELPTGNSTSTPLAVDGVVYLASGMSVVRAFDALTGRQLWSFDPQSSIAAGKSLRAHTGVRGIGFWQGKVYTGTGDGRLIALDAKQGTVVWSAQTTEPGDGRQISGAPRLFDGKVIIGHGGGDGAAVRGYVTTYDARSGKQLWRFYVVPGNPANGFEDEAQAMAAKTWSGEWWKFGGGGTVWNAMAYDPATDTIFIGTGNGSPWNHKVRSQGRGDNLFLCSIVALAGKTGRYKWHYQINPGETWDYNAAMDIELADFTIDGKARRVLMTAPKNGFFYVIDRDTGKLISAEPIAKVTWASRIDLATGRPVEHPDARYPQGKPFELWPAPIGAHSWTPMAFNPQRGLVYIPKMETGMTYVDGSADFGRHRNDPSAGFDIGVTVMPVPPNAQTPPSALLAWDPVRQKAAWQVPVFGVASGGVLTTAGDLVFQGQMDGTLYAYTADTGKVLWQFAAQAPILGTPISYEVNGRQYITLSAGSGSVLGNITPDNGKVDLGYRTQPRRLLTFALDANGQLPIHAKPAPLIPDPTFKPDPALAARGQQLYQSHCFHCHGFDAVSGGATPDLRHSPIPLSAEAFESVVHAGALQANGMPKFPEFNSADLEAIRQYLRTRRVP